MSPQNTNRKPGSAGQKFLGLIAAIVFAFILAWAIHHAAGCQNGTIPGTQGWCK
jgi:hypothetical protein